MFPTNKACTKYRNASENNLMLSSYLLLISNVVIPCSSSRIFFVIFLVLQFFGVFFVLFIVSSPAFLETQTTFDVVLTAPNMMMDCIVAVAPEYFKSFHELTS